MARGRNQKRTIDYFPHEVNRGQTISTIERKFGNDGYAFWFKLLEILGKTDDHFYDCSASVAWEYLLAETSVSEKKAGEILKTLVNLNAINPELWNDYKIIFSENFVNNFEDVYDKRQGKFPDLQFVLMKIGIRNGFIDNINSISAAEKEIMEGQKNDESETDNNPGSGNFIKDESVMNKNIISDNINSISDNKNSIPDSGNTQTKLDYTKLNNTTTTATNDVVVDVVSLFSKIWGRACHSRTKK